MNAPYFTSLSSQLEAKHSDLFDAHLFASLLVCLVAHERNLIIRTVEEDIGRVCNATSHMLSSIFGLSTHRVNAYNRSRRGIRHANIPPLIDSLFAPSAPPSSSHARQGSSASIFRRRAAQNLQASPSVARTRVLSSRSISAGSFSAPVTPEPPLHDPSDTAPQISGSDYTFASRSPPERGKNLNFIDPSQVLFVPTISAQRVTSKEDLDITTSPSPIKLPDVILFTNLDKASSSDYEALAEMLRTRKAVSTRSDDEREDDEVTLQPGFFIVSVCGIGNGKKRPEMPSYLLDEFSFSSTVLLDHSFPSLRSSGPSINPSVTLSEIEQLRSQCLKASRLLGESAQARPMASVSPHLQIYIQNLLSAARHHPLLQGTLISARCAQDLEDFTRVARVIFGSQAPTTASGKRLITLDCTEIDVTRVFASVVGHRLATRRQVCGPLGSMVRTAVLLPDENDMTPKGLEDIQPKETVNSVLAEILGKV